MFKSLIPLALIPFTVFAIDNMNDVKPHSYGLQNITINLTPVFSRTSAEYSPGEVSDKVGIGRSFGFGIHSKASLKEYHYKKAEIFWEGSSTLLYGKDNNGEDLLDVYGDMALGFSSNAGSLVLAGTIGIAGYWNEAYYTIPKTVTSEISVPGTTSGLAVDTIEPDFFVSGTKKGVIGYSEQAIGINTTNYSILFIHRFSIYNYNHGIRTKNWLSVPISFNDGRNSATIITPSYRRDNYTGEEQLWLTLSFSWIYR